MALLWPKKTNTYGNKILKNGHSSVLLFTTREATSEEVKERGDRSKRYLYEGVFMVAGYEYADINNEQRIRFRLIPTLNAPNQIVTDNHLGLDSSKMNLLRAKLRDYKETINQGSRTKTSEYFKRSKEVKQYALLRAKCRCESCSKLGPFLTKENNHFLEVHHIHRLADDGPDDIANVAALCPNCHREAHFGSDIEKYKINLSKTISQKEKLYE